MVDKIKVHTARRRLLGKGFIVCGEEGGTVLPCILTISDGPVTLRIPLMARIQNAPDGGTLRASTIITTQELYAAMLDLAQRSGPRYLKAVRIKQTATAPATPTPNQKPTVSVPRKSKTPTRPKRAPLPPPKRMPVRRVQSEDIPEFPLPPEPYVEEGPVMSMAQKARWQARHGKTNL